MTIKSLNALLAQYFKIQTQNPNIPALNEMGKSQEIIQDNSLWSKPRFKLRTAGAEYPGYGRLCYGSLTGT